MSRSPGEFIHDALDAYGCGYHNRFSGEVDMLSGDIAAALLAAGWKLPDADFERISNDQAR